MWNACVCVTNLGDFDVVLWGGLAQSSEVWVLGSAIWEQVAGRDRHTHLISKHTAFSKTTEALIICVKYKQN